jgi:hypothetical protein
VSVFRQDYPTAAIETVVPVMEKSLANSLQTIGTSHRARSGALTTSLNVARIRCVGDPDAVMLETWESWLLTTQVHSAVFAATSTGQETVTCKIRQEERQLVARHAALAG